MVFTASEMLTKQTLVQHPFGNAADEFRHGIDGLGRPGMGSGLVRGVFRWGLDCKWTRVGVTRLGWDVTVVTICT